MAIYQFYLAVIPSIGLLKKYKEIPSKIKVSTETGYFESKTEEYWNLAEIDSLEIIKEVDQLVDRANWGNNKDSYNWKTYTEEMDNDASLYTNEGTGKIKEFSFRADLREKNLKFLKEMIDLANKFDWKLMDRKGNLISPFFKEVGELIRISDSYKFLQDPLKYLTDLGEGRIKIE